MSKLDELIQEYCPDGVEYKKLGEIGKFYSGLSGKSKEDFKDGNKKFITYMNVFSNIAINTDIKEKVRIDDSERQNTVKYGDIIFTGSSETPNECGMSSVLTKQVYEDLFLNSFCFGYRFNDNNILLPEFSKYIFRSEFLRKQIIKTASGVTRFNVSKKKMENVIIPVPPLEVQREIIRILDNFTGYTEKLKAELTARKKQYEYYRDKLLMWDKSVKTVKLEELFPFIRNGFVGTVTPYFTDEKNGVRYIRGTNIHDGVLVDNDYVYINKEFHQKNIRSELKSDDILVVQSGHVGDCARVGEKYKGSNCHALIIMTNGGKCDSQYVVYYLQSREGKSKLEKITTGGTVKHILASAIKKLEIPIPPLETQKRIVHVLDNFEKICSDLNIGLPAEIEARQKQYEYYRDALLTFAAKGDIIFNRTEQNRTEQNRTPV